MKDEYTDELWDYYMQASSFSASEYNLINGVRDLKQFVEKSTNGVYTWESIEVDENGKISGLPSKMCELLNSQEGNARYEELRDEIYNYIDYKNAYGLNNILNFAVKYNISDSGMKIVDVPRDGNIEDNLTYYDNMTPII